MRVQARLFSFVAFGHAVQIFGVAFSELSCRHLSINGLQNLQITSVSEQGILADTLADRSHKKALGAGFAGRLLHLYLFGSDDLVRFVLVSESKATGEISDTILLWIDGLNILPFHLGVKAFVVSHDFKAGAKRNGWFVKFVEQWARVILRCQRHVEDSNVDRFVLATSVHNANLKKYRSLCVNTYTSVHGQSGNDIAGHRSL